MKERLPVILNIYKIKEDSVINIFGITLYHTAIEFADSEYAFGFHEESTSGIYDIKPMSYDEGRYVESIILGYTDRRTFFNNIDKLKRIYTGQSYNIILKNCNHFSNNVSKVLFNKQIPNKYSRFLGIGESLRIFF
jgi:hypothetical protein